VNFKAKHQDFNMKNILVASLCLYLVACSVGSKDQLSEAFDQSNSSVDSSSQTPPPTTTTTTTPNSFELFHPVRTNFTSSNQSACSQAASDAVGFPVTCVIAGGCDGGSSSTYGACLLVPVLSAERSNAGTVAARYAYSDAIFPKGKAAAAYLKHLYKTVYNREPDQPGFYYWLNDYFNNNATASTRNFMYLVDAIILAPECDEFQNANQNPAAYSGAYLTLLYKAILGRDPDAAGYNYWYTKLINGNSPSLTLVQFYQGADAYTFAQSFGL